MSVRNRDGGLHLFLVQHHHLKIQLLGLCIKGAPGIEVFVKFVLGGLGLVGEFGRRERDVLNLGFLLFLAELRFHFLRRHNDAFVHHVLEFRG